MSEPVATYVKQVTGLRGDARLYRLSTPLLGGHWSSARRYDYVVVSALNVGVSWPETYIFGADENGKVLYWGELDGSFQGGMDHEKALAAAGYVVADGAP